MIEDWELSTIVDEAEERGYNKAIDDFINSCKSNTLCQTFGLRQCDIEEIAEQLKVGGENAEVDD